jgi:hypothetical protein
LACAFGVAIAPAATARQFPQCPAPLCGPNLIQNSDAEAGPGSDHDTIVSVPDWTVTAGGFTVVTYAWSGGNLTATSQGPSNRGNNYFYGGPGPHGNVARATQTASLGESAAINQGLVHATLSGWLGGAINHEDHAVIRVAFLASDGTVYNTLSIGPVPRASGDGNNVLRYRSAAMVVPGETMSVRVNIVMTRYLFGAPGTDDNNGMADNLSLVLTCPLCS